jgi:hypothetical protein
MTKTNTENNITGYECRFAVFCPSSNGDNSDMHLIKEIVHKADGTTEPNIRLKRNYKRPFWVTQKGARNHEDKKEWENIDHVLKYESTQSDLGRSINAALGQHWVTQNDVRKIARSPYVYGCDILSTAVIKRSYQDKFKDTKITPYTSAPFDIETDVVHGTEEIIMATLSFGSRIITVIKKSFVAGYSDVPNRLQELLIKYLSEYVKKRGIVWETILVDTEAEIVTKIFERAHEWKPDFVSIWNITFDMGKVLKALNKAGIDPANVFSDPIVPEQYRHFNFKQGPKQKVTASGLVTPIKPSAQWHTVFCPSSFYFIDAMCAYRHIRTGNAEEPSYSLDNILNKELGIRKLKFEEAEGFSGLELHQFMQEKHPLEYIVYNVFDCISMEELDEKTKDLSLTMPLFSGCSDFENFKSQPRRLADTLHYFCLENKKVFGSTSSQMKNDFDEMTIGLDGWIVTLPAHLVTDCGLRVIQENNLLPTNIRGHVGDLDVSASYPNGGAVFNISKETTHKEIHRIEGVHEKVQRAQGINLSAGHVNAVEFACNMYGLPSMETMLKAFQNQQSETSLGE